MRLILNLWLRQQSPKYTMEHGAWCRPTARGPNDIQGYSQHLKFFNTKFYLTNKQPLVFWEKDFLLQSLAQLEIKKKPGSSWISKSRLSSAVLVNWAFLSFTIRKKSSGDWTFSTFSTNSCEAKNVEIDLEISSLVFVSFPFDGARMTIKRRMPDPSGIAELQSWASRNRPIRIFGSSRNGTAAKDIFST